MKTISGNIKGKMAYNHWARGEAKVLKRLWLQSKFVKNVKGRRDGDDDNDDKEIKAPSKKTTPTINLDPAPRGKAKNATKLASDSEIECDSVRTSAGIVLFLQARSPLQSMLLRVRL